MATHSFTCKQAIPAFTPQPQSITALWLEYLFYHPTEGRRLRRPLWLITYRNKMPPQESNLETVNHPSTNRWRSGGNVVGRINEVTLRRARLVLGWVTVAVFHQATQANSVSK